MTTWLSGHVRESGVNSRAQFDWTLASGHWSGLGVGGVESCLITG